MRKVSRRDFGKMAAGSLALDSLKAVAGKEAPASVFGGVQIGVQTYSFRDRPLEKTLEDIVTIGISSVELWGDKYLTPLKNSDEEFKSWRKKFEDAGVKIASYYLSFKDDWTGEQIDRGFRACRLLGTDIVTSSVSKKMVPRLDRACQKFKIKLGLHNHWYRGERPDQFEGPQDFREGLKNTSEWARITLDVGHFFASGHDPVKFIEEHHDRIVSLHLKDRDSDANRTDRPFGQGPTPLADVMRLIKKLRFKYAANIEWEVENADPVKGVANALAYLKQFLV